LVQVRKPVVTASANETIRENEAVRTTKSFWNDMLNGIVGVVGPAPNTTRHGFRVFRLNAAIHSKKSIASPCGS
jgi:hypothetical protein